MTRYHFLPQTLAISLLAVVPDVAGAQNLVRNGTFERNTAIGCDFNLINSEFTSKVADAVAFGLRNEICVMTESDGCYGPAGPVGPTKLGLAGSAGVLGDTVDAFSMPVQGGALPAGRTYSVALQVMPRLDFATTVGAIHIGVSTSATTFGTQVAEMTGPDSVWTLVISSFDSPIDAEYLTIEAAGTALTSWTHVDALRLEAGLPDESNSMTPGVTVSLTPGVIEPGDSGPATFRVDFGEHASAALAWLEFEVAVAGEVQTITHGPIQLDGSGRGEVTLPSGLNNLGTGADLSARFRAIGPEGVWVSPRIRPEIRDELSEFAVAH